LAAVRTWHLRTKGFRLTDEPLKDPAVASWVKAKRSGIPMLYDLIAYMNCCKEQGYPASPSGWIEECMAGNNATLAAHAKRIQDWCNTAPGVDQLSVESRKRHMASIRSFYLYNMVRLPPTRVESKESHPEDVHQPKMTATKFLEMMTVAVNAANLKEKAIFLVMLQSGMDQSTLAKVFNFVAYGQLVAHFGTEDWTKWDESKVPVKVELVRPKTSCRYYTFIDRDAIVALKNWLTERYHIVGKPITIYPPKDPRSFPISDPIFINKYMKPLRPYGVATMFLKTGKKTGLNIEPPLRGEKRRGIRYPFHSHEVRDTLITLRKREGVDKDVVDFFVGHKFDQDGYDKSPWDDPEHFRDEYRKLAKHLNIVSGKVEKARDEGRKEAEGRMNKYELALRKLIELSARGVKVDPADFDKILKG
jgi:hypothetical protein